MREIDELVISISSISIVTSSSNTKMSSDISTNVTDVLGNLKI